MFKLYPRQILNSRGEPTLEVKLVTDSFLVEASVPAGKSVSSKEAKPLVDNSDQYAGLTVHQAEEKITKVIYPAIKALNLSDPLKIDEKLLELDGTQKKTKLGANTLLAVSIAVYKAASIVHQQPLYQIISQLAGTKSKIPTPLINIINGGVHSHKTIEFQEFHLIPNFSKKTLSWSLAASWQVLEKLKEIINTAEIPWGYGDEGGISSPFSSNKKPFQLLIQAIDKAGLKAGKDFVFGLDAAANTFYQPSIKSYNLKELTSSLAPTKLLDYYLQLHQNFPLVIIEDPFAETDNQGWQLTKKLIDQKIKVVADDLTSTNPYLLPKLQKENNFNYVLIKPNQIGTVKETLLFAKLARSYHLNLIVSHRSGETCDPFIADLAVGLAADYVKFGNIRQGERVVKYNRLLEIERELL